MVLQDLTRQDMDIAIADFVSAISEGDTVVFVYSGHGWSDGNQNYLIGTDAPKRGSEELLKRISIPLRNGANGILDEIEARGASLRVAIIDACRDNPFESSSPTRSLGMTRGLNRFAEPPAAGTFLVFSAGAGQAALDRLSDDDKDPNGVFTRTFIPLLDQDMTLLDATKAAQEVVYQQASLAGYEQQPSFYDETRGNKACLSGDCAPASLLGATPEEAVAWAKIAGSNEPRDFYLFVVDTFPEGFYREQAVEKVAAIAAANPRNPGPAGMLGDMRRILKQYPEAIVAYTMAIDAVPGEVAGDWVYHYVRAISHERNKDWAKAETDLLHALGLNPDQPQVLNYLGYSWIDQGINLDKGLDMLVKAAAAAPDDGYIIDSLGWAYYRLGRFDEAVSRLEKAVQLKPTDPEINDHLADAYWRIGEKEKAKFHWSVAAALDREGAIKAIVPTKLAEGLPPVSQTTPQ